MKIIADENIPQLDEYFAATGVIIKKPGRDIVAADVVDADILLVRSVTQVNAALLQGSQVKFVGSATTGQDHLDTAWLAQHHIAWATAAGCNTRAVVEYIACTLAALQNAGFLTQPNLRAAVIGVGRIGARVAALLKMLGYTVLLCDPFKLNTVPFEKITACDLVTTHVPLVMTGEHPTFHLIDDAFLNRQNKNCVFINTSRGAIIADETIKQADASFCWCLDVYENEPNLNREIIAKAFLSTPHIAGYTVEAKIRGTIMLYEAAVAHGIITAQKMPRESVSNNLLEIKKEIDWQPLLLHTFDPRIISAELKKKPAQFDHLRKHFQRASILLLD